MAILPVAIGSGRWTFWRQALCASAREEEAQEEARSAQARPRKAAGCQANFDVLAHHPINTSGGPRRHAINSNDASSADLDRIARVLRAAERAGTVLPGPSSPLGDRDVVGQQSPDFARLAAR